jgi:hypothetical protein
LINQDHQFAIASRDGTFHILDAATGNEVFRLAGLRYTSSRTIGYVLFGLGATWCVLWWRATARMKNTPTDWSRYAGLMVFVCGMTIGLMLLGYRDEAQHLHVPTVVVAIALAGLSSATGFVLLFIRQCNKLANAYALVASASMACYVIWLANQSP